MQSPRNARLHATPKKQNAATTSASTSSAYELPVLNNLTLSRFTTADEEADISSPSPSPPPPSTLHLLDSRHDQLVMRRQPSRPREGGGAKRYPGSPARFTNLTNPVLDDLEFSGWGTSTHLDERSLSHGEGPTTQRPQSPTDRQVRFGSWKATGIAGNAVLGSVFYSFPAVVQVAGIYSPLSLFIACMIIFLFRPVMSELGSALPFNAANYAYLLNTSSKTLALVGASLALLDAATTASVSAASFAAYLDGEVALSFPAYWITIIVLVGFVVVCLCGLKESVGLAFMMLCIHVVSMTILILASTIHWARTGSEILNANWKSDPAQSSGSIAHAMFFGVCLGLLGLTGFECLPMSIEMLQPGAYPKVLRNMHYGAILLNAPLMLMVFANLPTSEILSGANVLSLLGEAVAARWLRILVVVDASIVLCGGILTGFLSVTSLLERLARDRILPKIFMKPMPISRALHVSLISSGVLSILIYVTTGASLAIVSEIFSLVFLVDMALFPISLLLLKFHRSRLAREPIISLELLTLTLLVSFTVIVGNIVLNPSALLYFAAYFAAILLAFLAIGNLRSILVLSLWVLDQSWLLHRFRWCRRISVEIARMLRSIRRQPVIYFTKTDSISHLVTALRYIQKNESTANVKLCHVYRDDFSIPSELEANHRILDEAYPAITVDLILVRGSFTPSLVAQTATKLNVPLSLVFMSTPSEKLQPSIAEWGRVRLITR